MFYNLFVLCLVMFSSFVFAQAPDYSQLDPEPYDPATDPNIDMFIGSWKESMPHNTHGSLIERDILMKGNSNHIRRQLLLDG